MAGAYVSPTSGLRLCPLLLLRRRAVVPLLAADDEALDAGLEILPLTADLIGLAGVDAVVVLHRFADGVQQLAELAHHRARLVEDALLSRLAQVRHRVGDEEA